MNNYEVEELEFTDVIILSEDSIADCPHCGGVIQEMTQMCLNCERTDLLIIIEE